MYKCAWTAKGTPVDTNVDDAKYLSSSWKRVKGGVCQVRKSPATPLAMKGLNYSGRYKYFKKHPEQKKKYYEA